jgi:hypothetical protein
MEEPCTACKEQPEMIEKLILVMASSFPEAHLVRR